MVVAESLIRSRSKADFRARRRFFETFEVLPVDQGVWEVVTDLAVELSMGGVIVSSGDVIIGACARLHDLTVVHYDSDYEVLGRMCGVQHDWVVAAGSL
jgi:predicted nucleic acid-binding protein